MSELPETFVKDGVTWRVLRQSGDLLQCTTGMWRDGRCQWPTYREFTADEIRAAVPSDSNREEPS